MFAGRRRDTGAGNGPADDEEPLLSPPQGALVMASPAKIAAGSAAALALAALGAGAAATRRWAKTADPTGGQPLAVPDGERFTVTAPDGALLAGWVSGAGPAVVLSHCWTGDH